MSGKDHITVERQQPSEGKKWLNDLSEQRNEHRQEITKILCADSNGELHIHGANLCIDFDLEKLSHHFDTVHLSDIDGALLTFGYDNININGKAKIKVTGEHDPFEIYHNLYQWQSTAPSDEAIENLFFRQLNTKALPQIELCDIHCSNNLLPRIIGTLTSSIAANYPRIQEVIRIIRQRHIEQLLKATCKAGSVIIISDLVSDITAPWINTSKKEELGTVMNELVGSGNFFTGCNPYAILSDIEQHNWLQQYHIKDITLTMPWLRTENNIHNVLSYAMIVHKH